MNATVTDAGDSSADRREAIIHSIEIIKPASDVDESTESHVEPAETDVSSKTMNFSNLNGIDIASLPVLLDVTTDKGIPLIGDESTDENFRILNEVTGENLPSISDDPTRNETVNEDSLEPNNLNDIIMAMNQSFQAFSDAIFARMDLFENKIDCLGKKMDTLERKQDCLAIKLNSCDKKIESELKLLAGAHVKLDMIPNTPSQKKNLPKVEFPFNVPSESVADVKKMLLTIKNDINIADDLERELLSFGGDTARKCTYGILRHLFTDDVAMKYTWQGTTEKDPFEKLTQINDLIKKCVREHYPAYTDDKYKKDVQEFLKHALTRVERRYF